MPKITVIGTTSWGITLAILLAKKQYEVFLWARTQKEADELTESSKPILATNVSYPPDLTITASLKDAFEESEAVLLVVPSQTMRQNIAVIKDYLKPDMLIISASKGLEMESFKRMSEVISEEIDPALRPNICVLSGPNLAREILNGLPASAVVANAEESIAKRAQELLAAPNFSVYTNSDVIGVELGGALKNIIALGAGMVDGMGYGDNAKAAFITRGLTEMAAMSFAMGASPLTLSGLTGLGDLIATCASTLSRNHYVGVELTKGRTLKQITKSMNNVAEGVATTAAVWHLARKINLGMPITEKIYEILYEGKKPQEVMTEILGSSGKHELAGRKWQLFSMFRHKKQ